MSDAFKPHRRQTRFIPTHVSPPALRTGELRGSSPRTWGTRAIERTDHRHQRFIPTHVGNAAADCSRWADRSVHPHARGEREMHTHHWVSKLGSSPRTWGTPHRRAVHRNRCRFIPTHVGNAAFTGGELTPEFGSSPRTWGTPRSDDDRRASPRFIPTHVGNAGAVLLFAADHAVHPHARGERSLAFTRTRSGRGSSPRTWGTPARCISSTLVARFIPTHVGM